MTLLERFDRHLASLELPRGVVLVAVSGGPDSLALLDLLVRAPAASGQSIHAVHVDHGIHPDSGAVAAQVRQAAEQYGLPLHLHTLALGPDATETRAREARYAALGRIARELRAVAICTAHHQDDQIETILMRVLRGSGPAGLAGMPSRRGALVRPLLPFRREELAEYLQERGIRAWDDPANLDLRHDRNWIRHRVLPILRERATDIELRILAVGRQAAANRAGWNRLLEDLPGLDLQRDAAGISLAVPPLRGYDSAVVRAVLGAAGRRVGIPIGPARAARLERLVKSGRSGAVAELGAGCAAELTFGRLRLFRRPAQPSSWVPQELAGNAGQLSSGAWNLNWRQEPAPPRLDRNAPASWFEDGTYVVRPWKPGDTIRPLGGTGRRLVVRCMQDARIARSDRAAWPVLERAGTILWVPGVCRSAESIPAPGTAALRIDVQLR